jgi:hypothetical protein
MATVLILCTLVVIAKPRQLQSSGYTLNLSAMESSRLEFNYYILGLSIMRTCELPLPSSQFTFFVPYLIITLLPSSAPSREVSRIYSIYLHFNFLSRPLFSP